MPTVEARHEWDRGSRERGGPGRAPPAKPEAPLGRPLQYALSPRPTQPRSGCADSPHGVRARDDRAFPVPPVLPFTLVPLRGPWGWSLFGLIWGLALLGLVCQFLDIGRNNRFMLALYLIMGWAIVVAIKPLAAGVAKGGLWLLTLGGLSYTFGVVFYVGKRIPYHHALWHLFVLLGSVFHFFAVLLYVVLPQ